MFFESHSILPLDKLSRRRTCLKYFVVSCPYLILSACSSKRSSPKERVIPDIPQDLHGDIEDIFAVSYGESKNRASVELDAWIGQRKYNTTYVFMPYMRSWVATFDSYWDWFTRWFADEDKLSNSQQKYYELVLGGAQGDAELGFISDNVLIFFLSRLESRLENFYEHRLSSWSRQQWNQKLESTLALGGGAPMSLGQAMNEARTTPSVLSHRSTGHAYRSFKATPQPGARPAGLPPSLRRSSARTLATRSASKFLAKTSTRLLGSVITFGIIAYEVYHEHEERVRSTEFLEQEILKSLDQLKEDLLTDARAGVLAATYEVSANALRQMTRS